MSIIQPEFEYVDRAQESIRYLEHGWPTDLCRWHSHKEYELHLITATRGKAFVGDYIGEFGPGSLFLTGPDLPHNWITDEHGHPNPVEVRDMLVQFSQDSLDDLTRAFVEFKEMAPMWELAKSGIEFTGLDVYLNVAGGLRISEPAADLAVAAALVSAREDAALPKEAVIFGEISLSSALRPVSQTENRLKEAAKLGFTSAIVPRQKKSPQGTELELRQPQDLAEFVKDVFGVG